VDLRPKLRQRILKAYEASGLSPDEYVQRMQGKDDEVNQLTRDALAEASATAAREDALLRALLGKFLADRQLRVEPEMQAWLLARLPRDAASLAEAVARLDHAALGAGGRITRALARLALAEWLETPGICEDSENDQRLPSPSFASLL
jgi:chromosomal replication initiation ATPase DnaA